MTRLTIITTFLLLSSLLLAGCLFQNNAQVSPAQLTVTEPTPSVAPIESASPIPTLSSPSDGSSDEDNGLAPVQGDQVDEGEEIVQ